MIFISVGSREYQFNRLIKKIDELIGKGKITDEVFGQIGQSTYIPKNFRYKKFVSQEEFKSLQRRANLIISHGGTGTLINALKQGKQVIAVPRLAKYNEHIDDHQIHVASILDQEGYLKCVLDIERLYDNIISIKENPITKRYNKPSNIISLIEDFIKQN